MNKTARFEYMDGALGEPVESDWWIESDDGAISFFPGAGVLKADARPRSIVFSLGENVVFRWVPVELEYTHKGEDFHFGPNSKRSKPGKRAVPPWLR